MEQVRPKVLVLSKVHFYTQCKQCSFVYVVLFFSPAAFFGQKRYYNIYFFFFVNVFKNQNSIWTPFSFYVHNFFKIIILDFPSNETKLSKITRCAWIIETIEHNFWIFELILISRNESDEISWLKSPTPEITIETTPENETRPPQAPKRKSQNMASIIMIYQTSAHYPYQGLVYVR